MRNRLFAETLEAAGFNLDKGFFELRFSEIEKLDKVRKLFRYSGRNNAGRLPVQQFWYAARRGKNK